VPSRASEPAAGVEGEAETRLRTRLETALFEVSLARETHARFEKELRRLSHQLAASESERASLVSRLAERERYVKAIHGSSGWRLLQSVRGLFGRRW
jgi:hypothetical protein